MWTWPTLELTEYEQKFVRVYKDDKFPGVLRRTYEILLNTVADPLNPELATIKLEGKVQIARRSRVFALAFAGNLGSWRLQIETASGEQMTPKAAQADGYPIVSSMISGGSWNALSALGDQPVTAGTPSVFNGNFSEGPMLIDPNWELFPNETLLFRGTPIANQPTTASPMTPPAQKLLVIAVHVWEFPNMVGRTSRMGAGPQLKGC